MNLSDAEQPLNAIPVNSTSWSPQQEEAIATIAAWMRIRFSQVFYLAGYAGTGKTTLALTIAKMVDAKVAFAAFTGKAAMVMRSKGCHGATTIHSLIYNIVQDPTTGDAQFILKPPEALDKFKLIVIDECSMVDEAMGKDLLSFGIPILVIGDPGQLPPVSGAGFFTSSNPNYLLTEIHRQAAESPILRLATAVREGRFRPPERPYIVPGLNIYPRSMLDPNLVRGADIVIVGRNETRMKYNRRFRELLKMSGPNPNKGEPVICLRNDHFLRISNGQIFRVMSRRVVRGVVHMVIEDQDAPGRMVKVKVRSKMFVNDVADMRDGGPLRDSHAFTFAYAITCHKSQGSQWSNVCVFNEAMGDAEMRRRWLYTAVTRASETLTLVI